MPRIIDAGDADGGITVTLPGQTPVALTCDARSVIPRDPFRGIGTLGSFTAENSSVVLASCLVSADITTECLGVVSKAEVRENTCSLGPDPTDCWATEAAAWDVQLAVEMTIAIGAVTTSQGENFAASLQAAQDSWETTRDRDCEVYWPLLFAQDGGAAYCHSEYAAKRIDFLREVVARSEFQG